MNDPFNSTTIPLFQMATFDGISAEDLGDAIKDEAHSNVVLLVDLWVLKKKLCFRFSSLYSGRDGAE